MTTAPYAARADAAIRSSLRHTATATATHPTWSGPIVLDLDADNPPRVVFDEEWAPHIQATLTCRVPDQATLDALDPRIGVRVQLGAGYTYPDGVDDTHQLADLGLRSREVNRPENTMTLTLASDEALIQDNIQVGASWWGATTYPALISTLITGRIPGAAVNVTGFGPLPNTQPVDWSGGDDTWPLLVDLADQIGAWVRHDGAGVWQVTPRPVLASQSSTTLEVGQVGTVVSARTELSRADGWGNVVLVRLADNAIASAVLTDGPLGVDTVPRKVKVVDRTTVAYNVNTSDAVAAAILARVVTRGRSITLDAVAAYWLRPGHTVLVRLPDGPPERALVARVEFTLSAGTMTVTTRQPTTD